MKASMLVVAVVMVALSARSGAIGAEQMTDERLYAEWAAYMDEVLPEWGAHKEYWREDLGWQAAPCLRGLVSGYKYSGDEKWLRYLTDQVDVLMERLEEKDGHPGWGGSITGEALILEPILEFIYVAQSDPDVSEETKKKAEGYLEIIDPGMIMKWDEMGRWKETHMGCGTYLSRISLPHNKNAHSGMMLLAAARATHSPERRTIYLDKARKLARRWRKFLRVRDDHYIWHYWDPAGRWDYNEEGQINHWVGLEHRGYGSIDVSFMAAAYDHGLVFSREDAEMHCRTFLKEIWNGDDEDPKYTALGTFNPDYVESTVFSGLARFDPKIFELWGKATMARPGSWGGMSAVPAYLLVKKEAAGFERRNADWTRDSLSDMRRQEREARSERPAEDRQLIR
jgi:hypothetical protein